MHTVYLCVHTPPCEKAFAPHLMFNNKEDEYIIKMLLNEKEVTFPIESDIEPYYKWDDVANYYQNVIDSLKLIKTFSIDKKLKYFKPQ